MMQYNTIHIIRHNITVQVINSHTHTHTHTNTQTHTHTHTHTHTILAARYDFHRRNATYTNPLSNISYWKKWNVTI